MDPEEYLKRFNKVKSFADKAALLEEAKAQENVDRELFARQRDSWEVPELEDPYKSLVPLFESGSGKARFTERKVFAEEEKLPKLFEVVQDEEENDEGQGEKDDDDDDDDEEVDEIGARKKDEASEHEDEMPTVGDLKSFEVQFLQTFCCNGLQFLNWDNVVVAGGAVVGCAKPIPEQFNSTNIMRRKYYHDVAYASSDIDLFLYALTEEEANDKLVEIYEAISAASPFEVICFRSAYAVTMVSQYPYRHVQVVLRIYSSPYEVLAGFDVDSCTFLYDGKQVYSTPRGHHALVSGYNTVDMSRRSPSYEMRLAKYAERGFAVLVPGLDRDRIDPNIFDKPWGLLQGLGKLIVLERLRTPAARLAYQQRQKLGQQQVGMFMRRRRGYDSRQLERIEKTGGSAEQSDYSTVFLPWGPSENARRTMFTMKKKDIVFNSSWFKKDREYNLHPCFFGTAEEVLQDCAPNDPPIPDDVPEQNLRVYVRGPLQWLQDDPGRQQIGSFNPITEGDWEAGAYFLTVTSNICRALNVDDVDALRQIIADLGDEWDPFQRDYLGRSPLHLGIMAGSERSCLVLLESDLVDATLRLPDGRSALHLVVQYQQPAVASALKAPVERAMARWKAYDALSDKEKVALKEAGETPPRNIVWEDVVECKSHAEKLTPLHMAVMKGSVDMVRILLTEFHADPCVMIPEPRDSFRSYGFYGYNAQQVGRQAKPPSFQPGWQDQVLFSVLLAVPAKRDEEDTSPAEIVDLILANGGTSERCLLMQGFNTVLHLLAFIGRAELLRTVVASLKKQDAALLKKLVNLLNADLKLPINLALDQGYLECAKILYEELPLVFPTEDHLVKARLLAGKMLQRDAEAMRPRGRLRMGLGLGSAAQKTTLSYQQRGALNQMQAATLDSLAIPIMTACQSLVAQWLELGSESLRSSLPSGNRYYGGYGNRWGGYYVQKQGQFDLKQARQSQLNKSILEDEDQESEDEKVAKTRREMDVNHQVEVVLWLLKHSDASHFERKDPLGAPFAGYIQIGEQNWGFGFGRFNSSGEAQKTYTLAEVLGLVIDKVKDAQRDSEYCFRGIFQRLLASYEPGSYEHYVASMVVNSRMDSSNETPETFSELIADFQDLIARLEILSTLVTTVGGDPALSPGTESLVSRVSESLRAGSGSEASSGAAAATGPPAATPASRISRRVPSVRGFLRSMSAATPKRDSKRMAAIKSSVVRRSSLTVKIGDEEKRVTEDQVLEIIRKELFGLFSITNGNAGGMMMHSYGYGYFGGMQRTASTIPEADRELVLDAFRCAWAGNTAGLEEILSRELSFPLLSCVDYLGNTLIVCAAVGSGNKDGIVLTLLKRAEAQYEESRAREAKPTKQAKKRVDNLKLRDTVGDGDGGSLDESDVEDEVLDLLAMDDEGEEKAQLGIDEDRLHAFHDALASDSKMTHVDPVSLLRVSGFVAFSKVEPLLPQKWLDDLEEYRAVAKEDHALNLKECDTQLDVLQIAILQGDVELVRALVNFAAQVPDENSVLGVAAQSWVDASATKLAIALDRVEVLEVLIETIGGGCDWRGVAESQGVKNAFKLANRADTHRGQRYRGITSILENQSGDVQMGAVLDEEEETFLELRPDTWQETAASFGSIKVFEWTTTQLDEVRGAMERFLKRGSGDEAFKPATIVRAFGDELVKLRTKGTIDLPVTAENPELKAASSTELLTALMAAISPKVLDRNSEILEGVVAAGQVEMLPVLIKAHRAVTGCSKADITKTLNRRSLRGSRPLFYALRNDNIDVMRVLVDLGADVSKPEGFSKKGQNLLLAAAMKPAAEFAMVMELVEQAAGPAEVKRMLQEPSHEGITALHQLFSVHDVKTIELLYNKLIEPELLRIKRGKEHQTLLHSAVKELYDSNVQAGKQMMHFSIFQQRSFGDSPGDAEVIHEEALGRVAFLLKFLSTEDLHEEDARGNTPLDLHLQGGITGSLKQATKLTTTKVRPPRENPLDAVAEDGPVQRGLVDYEVVRERVVSELPKVAIAKISRRSMRERARMRRRAMRRRIAFRGGQFSTGNPFHTLGLGFVETQSIDNAVAAIGVTPAKLKSWE